MKYLLLILVGTIIAGGALFGYKNGLFEKVPGVPVGSVSEYSNSSYGISFTYPKNYILSEREVGDAHRRHYVITLIEDTPSNRDILEGRVIGGEGPTAITIEAFQNNLDNMSVEGFVTGTNNSNYKLALFPYEETSLSGMHALSYTWDGLYRGDSVVVSHKDNILMFSVTYLAPEDSIRSDFSEILSSVAFF